jgi:hypothetical protein
VRGALLLLATALLPACIAPSVLDANARLAATPALPAAEAWQPATAEALIGYWESVAIEGEAAGALRRVCYLFERDGGYTGAALIALDGVAKFQTLSGRWQFGDGGLDLGDDERVVATVAPDHLRFTGDGGVVILRRVVLE